MLSIGSEESARDPSLAPDIRAASPDLSHIYFSVQNGGLFEGVGGDRLYDWTEGQLTLLPQPVEGVEVTGAGAYFHSPSGFVEFGATVTSARPAHNGPHLVSDDGSTFFWHGRSPEAEWVGLFDEGTGTKIAPGAVFIGASHDGNAVYFASSSQLGEDATPGGGIYSYTVSNDEFNRLTPAAGPSGLGVTEAVISDDTSHVYFIATAAVTPGAEPGAPNLYVQDGDQTRFIATVPGAAQIARTSQDGHYAILSTTASLAGAQTNGHNTIYEYDDQARVLACVSCRGDGSPTQGDASVDDTQPNSYGQFSQASSPRNIAGDGRVFFATTDRLVPEDTDSASDVYEYFQGSVSLLSAASGGHGASIADSGDDGRDVFIVTGAALLPEDEDGGLQDLYDVRSTGGYPAPPRGHQPGCKSNCQDRSGTPPGSVLGSETATGASPSKPRISVSIGHSLHDQPTSVLLDVKVGVAGDISLWGESVKKRQRAVAQAGTYSLKATLNAAGRSFLKSGGTLRVPIKVTFEAGDGSTAFQKLTLAFRPSGGHSKGARR
jgi:hypothetical protein